MYEDFVKFICLIDSGSFTKASIKLHISQPALSVAIKKLEKSLHTDLILRSNRSFKLTKAGKIVYDHAVGMNLDMKDLSNQLTIIKNKKPTIKIGLIDSVADSIFIQQNNFFEEINKILSINLVINNSDFLVNQLNERQLDIVFITRSINTFNHYLKIGSSLEPFLFVTNRNNLDQVNNDLSNKVVDNFLSYNLNSRTSKLIDNILIDHGIKVQKSFVSTSPSLILQLILKGFGSAFLPVQTIKPYINNELSVINIDQNNMFFRTIDIFCLDNELARKYAVIFKDKLSEVHSELSKIII